RAVARDSPGLVLEADHEAGDVLEEDERDPTLAAELDEVGALLRGLGEQNAVVRENADRITLDPREAAHEGLAVELLELVEAAAVDEPADQLACIELMTEVLGDQPVDLGRVGRGRLRIRDLPRRLGLARVQVAHDPAR